MINVSFMRSSGHPVNDPTVVQPWVYLDYLAILGAVGCLLGPVRPYLGARLLWVGSLDLSGSLLYTYTYT